MQSIAVVQRNQYLPLLYTIARGDQQPGDAPVEGRANVSALQVYFLILHSGFAPGYSCLCLCQSLRVVVHLGLLPGQLNALSCDLLQGIFQALCRDQVFAVQCLQPAGLAFGQVVKVLHVLQHFLVCLNIAAHQLQLGTTVFQVSFALL